MKDEHRGITTKDPKELRAQEPSLAREFFLNHTWDHLAKRIQLLSNPWDKGYWEGYEVI